MHRLVTYLVACTLALAVAREAHAAQTCSALMSLDTSGAPSTKPAPPVVYIAGPSGVKALIAGLAPAIFLDGTSPATIVYVQTTSCQGAATILTGTPLAANTTASYWDPNSKVLASGTVTDHEETCTITASTLTDIGTSDVFAETCGYAAQGIPAGMKDFQGPIQSMTFAVPKGSTETVISAQAAYLTFGLGVMAPWTDPTHLFIHSNTSGTQLMMSIAIGVPATRWVGVNPGGSTGVFAQLTAQVAQADLNKSIGIISATYSTSPSVQMLAYQHYGQTCAYKPDVSPGDNMNTRNGRYAIWGPMHLFTRVDGSGLASNPLARNLLAYLTGLLPPPLGVNLIGIEANIHVVPPCAMNVTRSAEMGTMTPVVLGQAPRCSCAFDKAATGMTSCKSCSSAAECGANQNCSFGFCEATQ